jgi:hypothetical protein
MSCGQTQYTIPGTPTISSGYTAKKIEAARQCDQQRLLNKLRGESCCAIKPNPKSAIYSSILTQEKAIACQANQVDQAFQFPRVGVPESVRIQKKTAEALECGDGGYKYGNYRRFVEIAPCPPPTAEQLNSTTPKPTFQPGCTPSRF